MLKISHKKLLRIFAIFACITALSLSGCARRARVAPPPLEDDVVAALLQEPRAIFEFKGFGDVTITASGQSMSGTIDAVRRNTGFFSAQIYTPFGSAIAAISAEDSVGRITVNRETLDFRYGDSMEAIPFPSAAHLTFGTFIGVITASMPNAYWDFIQTPPDTSSRNRRRNTVTLSWITDTLTMRVQLSERTRLLENVVFNYDFSARGGGKYSFRFARFRNAVPHEITVRESARSNIVVTYEDVIAN